MKIGPFCSDKCYICAYAESCLIGNGEEGFVPAEKEQVVKRLDRGEYVDYSEMMIRYLETAYGYAYSGTAGAKKPKWEADAENEIVTATDAQARWEAILKAKRLENIETFLKHGFRSEDLAEIFGYRAEEIAEVQRQL